MLLREQGGMKVAVITYINHTTQHLRSAELLLRVHLTNISIIERQLTGAMVNDFSHPHWIYFHKLIAFSPYLRIILNNLKAKTLNKLLKSMHINNVFPFHSFLRVTTANFILLLQYPYTLSSVQHAYEGLLFLLTDIYEINHLFYFLLKICFSKYLYPVILFPLLIKMKLTGHFQAQWHCYYKEL